MDISVIVPVYNTAEYLKECIESVLSIRDSDKIEIILINDGSTDNSLEICQKYTEQNTNIILIDKINEGAAQARNCGIRKAKGKYLLFLDSDDCYLNLPAEKHGADEKITPFSLLYQTAEDNGLDVLSFNYTRSKTKTAERNEVDYYVDDILRLVNSNIYISSSCTKLIKKDVLINNNIYFETGNLAEDILFSGLLLNVPDINIGFCNEVLYYYRVRGSSTTNSLTDKNIKDTFLSISTLIKFDNELLLSYAAFQYATLMINIHLSSSKIDNSTLQEIFTISDILKYNKSNTIKIIYIVKRVLGVKLTSKLLSIVFKAKARLV